MEEYDKEIFRISKDIPRTKDLIEMAKERLNLVIKSLPKEIHYKFLEEYYEISLQLITAIMYSDGFKTLSHVKAIEYLKNYKEFSLFDVETLEQMRKFRHGVVYYGRKEGGNFFINHEKQIKSTIIKLLKLAEAKAK